MLYSAKTVMVVAKHLHENNIPFVLDPVIEAEAGGKLLRPEAVLALKKHLIPLARVVTPNIFEAEALTGIHVSDIDSADAAASKILEMGAEAVIVKGGHMDLHRSAAHGQGDVTPSWKKDGRRQSRRRMHLFRCPDIFSRKRLFVARGRHKSQEGCCSGYFTQHKVGRGVGPVNQAAFLIEDTSDL
jgi:hydroxymethylpyrimidine/phosphomethylpyrimidine kinase